MHRANVGGHTLNCELFFVRTSLLLTVERRAAIKDKETNLGVRGEGKGDIVAARHDGLLFFSSETRVE